MDNDITVETCTFSNMTQAGIRGIASSITVEGFGDESIYDFYDCNYGISLSWPNGQMESTNIFKNNFNTKRYDVLVNGGSGVMAEQRTNFNRNQSDNSWVSFLSLGENQFSVERNTFDNSWICNYASNSGDEENNFSENEYTNSSFGDALNGDNLTTYFCC